MKLTADIYECLVLAPKLRLNKWQMHYVRMNSDVGNGNLCLKFKLMNIEIMQQTFLYNCTVKWAIETDSSLCIATFLIFPGPLLVEGLTMEPIGQLPEI